MGRLRIGENREKSKRLRNGDDHRGWHLPWIALVHGRLSESDKEKVFEAAVIISMLAVYAINRFTPLFDIALPFNIAKNHLNDACAGLMFPAYVNALCIAAKSRWRIAGVRSALLLGLVCCAVWEGFAPLVVPWSVGDPIDCACYVACTFSYTALRHFVVDRAERREGP